VTAWPPVLSVVIVNFQARSLLVRCLQSLPPDSAGGPLEVIVVDNGSTDGSVEAVRDGFPEIKLIANPNNAGLSRAFNQGAREAAGRYVLFLDNDTIVQPGALDTLCAFLDTHADVWAVAPKVVYPDGRIQGTVKALPSPAVAAFGRNSILTRLWPSNPISRNYLIYRSHSFTEPFQVGYAATCALMVRREALDQIGAMD
jgi:GT2 family glycosyltransferase